MDKPVLTKGYAISGDSDGGYTLHCLKCGHLIEACECNKPRFRAWIPGVDTLHPYDEVHVIKRSWLGWRNYSEQQGYVCNINGWYATSPHSGSQVVIYRILRRAK